MGNEKIKMKNDNLKRKNSKDTRDSGKFQNFGFLIAIFIFSLFIFNLKDASAAFTISRPSTLNSGLVGWWTMDGKNVVNGVALDRSGNAYNAKLINIASSTFYSTGKIGQGFLFDGTNDIASTTRINNPEITVAGWFNKTANDFAANTSDAMFGAYYYNADIQLREGFYLKPGDNVGNNCGGAVPAGSGYLCSAFLVITTNGTTKTTKTSLFNLSSISKNGTTTNEWFHIAGTYTQSDGNQRLYINGVLRDTDLHVAGNTVVPLATTTAGACYLYMKIGYSCISVGYFNGKLDDVRLYNRALSGAEIKSLYNQGVSKFNKSPTNTLTSGLVGYWTFDGKDVVSGVALDSTANANNGNLINIATSTFYSAGKIGQGFNFDGVDDFVNMGDVLDASDASMSVSVWVKLNKLGLNQKIAHKRHSASPGLSWEFYITTLNEASFQLANTASSFFSAGTNPLSMGVWYHLVGVKNGNDLLVYKNGAADPYWTGTVSGTVQNGNGELGFGSDGISGSSDFNGLIDDVRVYNRALSAGEIKTLYNMGR